MRVRSSLRWLGLSISFAMLACGSSADVSDNSGDDGGADTSSTGDSHVTTDSRSDTTAGDSAKDGNADTKTSDSSSSDTSSSDSSGGGDSSTGDDTATSDDTATTDTASTDTASTDTASTDSVVDATPIDGGTDVSGIDVIGTDAICAGIECVGFPASFVTGCTVDDNCVGEMHQVDCCGAMRVIGMNHSESTKFCAAEYGGDTGAVGCRSEYPSPAGCSSDVTTADDGASTTDPTKVAVHCVLSSTSGGTCKTFVCGTAGGTPCPSSRRIGTCGP